MKYDISFVENVLSNKINILSLEYIGSGNHCDAFCINNNLVIKMPKIEKASKCLLTEINILQYLNEKITINIPNVLQLGTFVYNDKTFNYFISRKVEGKTLTKIEFNSLTDDELEINAQIVANFLKQLHKEKSIFNIKRKDFVPLHGDFSLNHILFDDKNKVCGILDFADARVGKYTSDFVYLLDDEDQEEFGMKFGLLVLEKYKNL